MRSRIAILEGLVGPYGKPPRKATAIMAKQHSRMRAAAKKCKGKKAGAFRKCMRKALRKKKR